jgi:hypothetical protein
LTLTFVFRLTLVRALPRDSVRPAVAVVRETRNARAIATSLRVVVFI